MNTIIEEESTKLRQKPTIVIAEDDSTFGMLLKFRLDEDGFVTYIAKDGIEALELIAEKKPSVIVSDIMMPFVSGLEIVERVRNELELKTPFIVISSAGQEEMILKAFELGATDFLSKPFSISELLVRINRLL